MSELRRIEPISLAGLKPAPVGNDRPELMWIAPTDLLVDPTYQREVSERSLRLIRKLIETFSWNRVKPPIVVKTGAASFHVVDGQHTAIVAAPLKILQIPIFVVNADSIAERARAFVGHNRDRVAVSPLDIYRALLACGDPEAQDVDNVCTRAGVRLRNLSPSSAVAEGDTAAVGLVRRLVKERGVVRARKVLQTLVKARRAPITGVEISAADTIICFDRPKVDLDEFSVVIAAQGDAALERAHARARREGIPYYRALADAWLKHLKP